MKKIFFVLIFLAFLFQFSFFAMFAWNSQIPNLILIIATIIGTRDSFKNNIGYFLAAGFIFEVFSIEFFGFYLILFALTGSIIWFLYNIALNKEYSFIVEILFWLLVKIVWDLFFKLESFLSKLFQKNVFDGVAFLSGVFLRESIIFVFSGFLITVLYKKFFSEK